MQNKNQLFSKLFVILFSITILLSSCSNEEDLPLPPDEEFVLDEFLYPQYCEGKINGVYFKFSRDRMSFALLKTITNTTYQGDPFRLEQYDYRVTLGLEGDFWLELNLVNPQLATEEIHLVDMSERYSTRSYIATLPKDRTKKFYVKDAILKVNQAICLEPSYDPDPWDGYYYDLTLNADVIKDDNSVVTLRDIRIKFYYSLLYQKLHYEKNLKARF